LLAGSEFEVRWSAADPDGDPLAYWIEYSPDGGRTWDTVIKNVTGDRYVIDLSDLPGSRQGMFRIHASDGVNTVTAATSGEVVLARKPPMAGIVAPSDGEVIRAGAPIDFRGAAIDPEDGLIGGSALRWTSNLAGEIGVGETLLGRSLPPGDHELTLTATDSDNMLGRATIRVTVE
jgi:hypothetical protein